MRRKLLSEKWHTDHTVFAKIKASSSAFSRKQFVPAFYKRTCQNTTWLLTQTLILCVRVSILCDWTSQQCNFPQTSCENPAWDRRLPPPCVFDNLHHTDWWSQTHHFVPLRSQTLRGCTRLGNVPTAPLASDSAQQYWRSFLGCAANTLIISLYHSAVTGISVMPAVR